MNKLNVLFLGKPVAHQRRLAQPASNGVLLENLSDIHVRHGRNGRPVAVQDVVVAFRHVG